MADDATKKPDIKLVETPPESIFDDLDELRRVAEIKVKRKVVPVNVRVGKPPNNVFFRVNPDPAMMLNTSVIVGSEGSDDYYFIHPRMLHPAPHPTLLPRLRKVTIAVTCFWPGNIIGLWPVPKIEETRIACWKTMRAGFELGQSVWAQLVWNDERRDYDLIKAEDIRLDPVWSGQTLNDLLRLGFDADRILDSADHDYVKRLRGLAD